MLYNETFCISALLVLVPVLTVAFFFILLKIMNRNDMAWTFFLTLFAFIALMGLGADVAQKLSSEGWKVQRIEVLRTEKVHQIGGHRNVKRKGQEEQKILTETNKYWVHVDISSEISVGDTVEIVRKHYKNGGVSEEQVSLLQ